MRGYAQPRGASGKARPYVDTLVGLRQVVEQVSERAQYQRFARRIEPIRPQDLKNAAEPAFYSCKGPNQNPNCDNAESRINDVLSLAADADENSFFIIVTDLFLSNSDLIGSTAGSMRAGLARALRKDKSVGIIGVVSPFDGEIYDLPPPTQVHKHAGLRPFFFVLVGAQDQVHRFYRVLHSEFLAELPADHVSFAVFGRNVAKPVVGTTPVRLPEAAGIRIQGRSGGTDGLDQWIIGRKFASPAVNRPTSDLQLPFMPALAGYELRTSLWMRTSESARSCDAAQWIESKGTDGLAAAALQGTDLKLTYFPQAPVLTGLPARRTFVLRVQVDATRLEAHSGPTAWMRSLSFDEKQLPDVLKDKSPIFPVLNLHRFGGVLEAILNEDFQRTTVIDQIIAFQTER